MKAIPYWLCLEDLTLFPSRSNDDGGGRLCHGGGRSKLFSRGQWWEGARSRHLNRYRGTLPTGRHRIGTAAFSGGQERSLSGSFTVWVGIVRDMSRRHPRERQANRQELVNLTG